MNKLQILKFKCLCKYTFFPISFVTNNKTTLGKILEKVPTFLVSVNCSWQPHTNPASEKVIYV